MLVTDPKQRANLGDIMNHPWITKGFNAPPENYLPHREPLTLPLDQEVVDKMTGFDFGTSEYITRELMKVLNSEEYQAAVRLNAREPAQTSIGNERKRGVFDFYKRRSSVISGTALQSLSAEAVQLGTDPINAFSPLISIYYLVREKQERERIESNPGALSMPISPNEKPIKIPDLPAPEAAYTNSTAYEIPGEKTTGGRSRPRSRTHGEDDVTEGIQKVSLNAPGVQDSPTIVTPPTDHPPVRKESTATSLLRRFSTRRSKEPPKEKAENSMSVQLQLPPDSPLPPRKNFSVRRSRNRDSSVTPLHPGGSTPHHQPELLSPPNPPEARTMDRSASVNSADYRRRHSRRGLSEGQPPIIHDPPLTSGSDRSSISGQKPKGGEPAPMETRPSASSRAAATRTKSLGHSRRESTQVRRFKRDDPREANVPEETDQELAGGHEHSSKPDSIDVMKPVYLKGLFSVSTTSNKSLFFIRTDIIRVLRQLGVDYREIKGGFDCRHAPSIDLNRINDNPNPSPEQQSAAFLSHRRRISFLGSRNTDRERDDMREQERFSTPKRRAASSKRHGNGDVSATNSDESEESLRRRSHGERPAGETSTHVQSELGRNMVMKFEIFIVKVPLFSLHGIQFKKVAGDTWAYKDVAQKILDALRL